MMVIISDSRSGLGLDMIGLPLGLSVTVTSFTSHGIVDPYHGSLAITATVSVPDTGECGLVLIWRHSHYLLSG